jgi:hypothetical protein
MSFGLLMSSMSNRRHIRLGSATDPGGHTLDLNLDAFRGPQKYPFLRGVKREPEAVEESLAQPYLAR